MFYTGSSKMRVGRLGTPASPTGRCRALRDSGWWMGAVGGSIFEAGPSQRDIKANPTILRRGANGGTVLFQSVHVRGIGIQPLSEASERGLASF